MGDSNPLIVLSAERLVAEELCPRRRFWTEKYANLRVSLIRALYMSLDAGLRTSSDPEKSASDQMLALARSPGLDIVGHDIYAVATHYAKLAGILATALRSFQKQPWAPIDPIPLPGGQTWHSGLYRTEDDRLRRVALVDRWTDERRMEESWGWRTIGELCAVNQPILVTSVTIGPSHDRHRHSPWTRCNQAPHTNVFRFKRKASTEGFAPSWRQVWREDSDIPTETWLTRMREDGCIPELVQTMEVKVPQSKDAYLSEMDRIGKEILKPADALPQMRLAGCFGFSPCNFRCVCHGGTKPEDHGFVRRPVKTPETKELQPLTQ